MQTLRKMKQSGFLTGTVIRIRGSRKGENVSIPSITERREHLENAERLFNAIRNGQRVFPVEDWEMLQRCAACYAAVIIMSMGVYDGKTEQG